MENIIKILPNRIVGKILELGHIDKITEIRLRTYKKICVYYGTKEQIIDIEILLEDLITILRNISSNSIYSVQQDINNGFLTISGGHRVGVVGEVILSEGKVKNIKNISSMNIRIAHEYIGVSDKIIPFVFEQGKRKNCIIVSPPLCGKTTLLRDIVRNLSNKGKNIVIVDERGEIAAMSNGKSYLDIGERTDVISYVPKEIGMQMAVRSMAPDIVVTDEIGTSMDVQAINYLCRSGVSFITTMHGNSLKDVMQSDIKEIILKGYVDTVILLSKKEGIGTIEKVYIDLLNDIEGIM